MRPTTVAEDFVRRVDSGVVPLVVVKEDELLVTGVPVNEQILAAMAGKHCGPYVVGMLEAAAGDRR